MSENKFETLTAMGVDDVQDIERYSTRIEGDVDILKLYFHRHQGEWFAKSKKFKFKRLHKNVKVNDGLVPYRATTESSPYYLRAIAELDQLVAQEKGSLDRKELLLEELDHLEKVVARKIEDLKRQIGEL
ncbi:DUF3461 family protein [Marinobacterium sedimentorum]|uniref:DUF3461 family protein n=1 Tax=Marinobacterium sedimentorum TaxID=2927804 RepID=UPI0020C6FB7F|nr:DUF3461 family protein [Marinobacterium sedimentorum]MCP8688624.1 DUF3461 family protein [Marinobacterium sedimentorum]